MGTILLFLAPLLVSLSLKVSSLVGIDQAPNSLSLVAGTGALLALFANPFFGKMSDRTSSPLGMRRPWMVVGLAAVLPDQVPIPQRGQVAGVLGIDKIGSAQADVPRQIFLGTLAMSVVIVATSLLGGGLSDRTGRREIFVCAASFVFGLAMFVIAVVSSFNGFLIGMAIGGLGLGLYMAVDLALVADVLPDKGSAAKDLGVMNIAGALPSSVAPAIAPAILALGSGSNGVLYAVAGSGPAVCGLGPRLMVTGCLSTAPGASAAGFRLLARCGRVRSRSRLHGSQDSAADRRLPFDP